MTKIKCRFENSDKSKTDISIQRITFYDDELHIKLTTGFIQRYRLEPIK